MMPPTVTRAASDTKTFKKKTQYMSQRININDTLNS